jgi:hypothetical protein
MVGKLIGVFRDFGPWAGVLYLVDRALRLLPGGCGLFVYELFVQPIASLPSLPARLARDITWREIAADDEAVHHMPARAQIKQQRFANGARCLGVWRRDEWLGYLWLSFTDYDEDEVRCTYGLPRPAAAEATSAFDFDLHVLPAHRMGIGFLALWHAAGHFLRERGVGWSYSRMTRFNLASRRAHLRLGARVAGRAVFLRLGRAELMLATLHPYLALTFGGRARLRLPLPQTDCDEAAPGG